MLFLLLVARIYIWALAIFTVLVVTIGAGGWLAGSVTDLAARVRRRSMSSSERGHTAQGEISEGTRDSPVQSHEPAGSLNDYSETANFVAQTQRLVASSRVLV